MVIPFLAGTLYGLVPRLEVPVAYGIFFSYVTNEHGIFSIIACTRALEILSHVFLSRKV